MMRDSGMAERLELTIDGKPIARCAEYWDREFGSR
jgi:hypothetical protein